MLNSIKGSITADESELMNVGTVFQSDLIPGWVFYIKKGILESETLAYSAFQKTINELGIEHVANWITISIAVETFGQSP